MADNSEKFEEYFSHLKQISLLGRVYKKYFSSPLLLRCTRQFGVSVMEVGCGVGSGILGAYPQKVDGLDINAEAVKYCQNLGLKAQLINDDGVFPIADGKFDCCVLDNVLEHIAEPRTTLDECYRITQKNGGLIVAVPGELGFQSDSDHKMDYKASDLMELDDRWELLSLFSIPFFVQNEMLSKKIRQYCLVATYRKVAF